MIAPWESILDFWKLWRPSQGHLILSWVQQREQLYILEVLSTEKIVPNAKASAEYCRMVVLLSTSIYKTETPLWYNEQDMPKALRNDIYMWDWKLHFLEVFLTQNVHLPHREITWEVRWRWGRTICRNQPTATPTIGVTIPERDRQVLELSERNWIWDVDFKGKM